MNELKEMLDQARASIGDDRSVSVMATLTHEHHRAGNQPRYFPTMPTELWHSYCESPEECLVELRRHMAEVSPVGSAREEGEGIAALP